MANMDELNSEILKSLKASSHLLILLIISGIAASTREVPEYHNAILEIKEIMSIERSDYSDFVYESSFSRNPYKTVIDVLNVELNKIIKYEIEGYNGIIELMPSENSKYTYSYDSNINMPDQQSRLGEWKEWLRNPKDISIRYPIYLVGESAMYVNSDETLPERFLDYYVTEKEGVDLIYCDGVDMYYDEETAFYIFQVNIRGPDGDTYPLVLLENAVEYTMKSPQEWVQKKFNLSQKIGGTNIILPELGKVWDEIKEMPPYIAYDHLVSKQNSIAPVEILGVTFSGASLVFGIQIVMLGVMAYMCIQVNQCDNTENRVAWIGVYKEKYAIVAYTLIILSCPLVSFVLLIKYSQVVYGYWLLTGVSFAAVLMMSLVYLKCHYRNIYGIVIDENTGDYRESSSQD